MSTAASSAPRRACELPPRFTVDTTLQNLPGVAYSIAGPVNVGTDSAASGAAAGGQQVTLTIQAGTLLFASAGNDYLVVNRGSRLNAIGTAATPIIFTARANLLGTRHRLRARACGAASSCSAARRSATATPRSPGGSADCQQVIEGTTSALYGGAIATDNSGTLQYVQIRYSGFAIAPGNELQGLTLGGVGKPRRSTISRSTTARTTASRFSAAGANLKHLVITGADDDDLDTDLGYRGTIQFVISVHGRSDAPD